MKRVATAVIRAWSCSARRLPAASARRLGVHEPAAPPDEVRDELTVWVGWSARELSEFKKVAAEYDTQEPAVEVKVVGGINDDKIIAALRGGNAPDVVSSFTSTNVGVYCPSGGWIDLAPS